MGLIDNMKKELSLKIQGAIPSSVKPHIDAATEIIGNLAERQQEQAILKARTQYILPHDIEQDILKGVSYSKCKRKLRAKKGFDALDSKELDRMVSNAGTRLSAERTAKQFEKDFEYYQISPSGKDACHICKEVASHPIKFKDRKVGVNFPPLHDGCRCCISIVEPKNWDKWMNDYEKRHKK